MTVRFMTIVKTRGEAHIGLWDQELEVEVRQMMDAPETGC